MYIYHTYYNKILILQERKTIWSLHLLNAHVQVPYSYTFLYNAVGHVIADDLNVINNISLRDVQAKWPKYHDPKSKIWKRNFKTRKDYMEDYASQWAKCERGDIDTLSEWIKAAKSLIQLIQNLPHAYVTVADFNYSV